MAEQDSNYNFLTKDIIGNKPRWIVRWGITVIFLILFSLTTTLSLIKYPVSVSLPGHIEFDRKPIPLIAAENSILTDVYESATTGVVEKGTDVMRLETLTNHSGIKLSVPITGYIYMSDKYKINSFISKNQVLGFILPYPNEHVVKLTITSDKLRNLKVGQKVMVKINIHSNINPHLEGKINFISSGFFNSTYYVTVKFPSTVNKQLLSDPLLNTVDSVKCTAGVTIDTISYLQYIFRKNRAY